MTIFFSLLQKFSYENFLEITTYFALVFSNYWIDGIQLPKIMSELAGTNELELVLYNISYYWILSLILSNISWKMYCNLFPKFDCFIRSYLVEKVYRKFEAEYSDNRRPDSVIFSDNLEDDLKRRDFTINAIDKVSKIL